MEAVTAYLEGVRDRMSEIMKESYKHKVGKELWARRNAQIDSWILSVKNGQIEADPVWAITVNL